VDVSSFDNPKRSRRAVHFQLFQLLTLEKFVPSGLAPSAQLHFYKGQVSSPYVGLGFVYASLSLDNVTSSTNGFFANAGWEWRWTNGLGILLGAGVSHLGNVHATDGVNTIDRPGGTLFNLEVGLRYMFL
jgi:hypothetical protein